MIRFLLTLLGYEGESLERMTRLCEGCPSILNDINLSTELAEHSPVLVNERLLGAKVHDLANRLGPLVLAEGEICLRFDASSLPEALEHLDEILESVVPIHTEECEMGVGDSDGACTCWVKPLQAVLK